MAANALLQTDVPGALSRRSGKVRDIYDYGDALLIVATDRISAFDVIMPTGVPGKGRILSGLSKFWFDRTADIAPNHVLSTDPADFPQPAQAHADVLRRRAMLCRKADVFPVECVVRGYLAGSAWKEYEETGLVLGHDLPTGLELSDRLPVPIFTPATKADSGHDINLSPEQAAAIVGPDVARELERLAMALYEYGSAYARQHGFILADTKFEFGCADDEIILVDEALTPDSSRYWDVERYQPGLQQEAFDKQYLRDWLEELVQAGTWNKEAPGPQLPDDVVQGVLRRYVEAYERLTGEKAPV